MSLAIVLLLVSSVNEEVKPPTNSVQVVFYRPRWSGDFFELHGEPWKLRRIQVQVNDQLMPGWKEIVEKEMFWVNRYWQALQLMQRYKKANKSTLRIGSHYFHEHVLDKTEYHLEFLGGFTEY